MNMVKIKAILSKIATWISAPESIAGSGFKWNDYGNPVHKRATNTDTYGLTGNDGTVHHKFYWEQGQQYISDDSGDVGMFAERTDTGVKVGFAVGSGGTNHGIYSYKQNKWLIYGNAADVFVNDHKIAPDASVNATNSSNVSQGTITLYRRGGIVFVKINNFKTSAAASAQCATVPAGYRPVIEAYIPCNNQNYNLRITPAGVVSFTMASGSATVYGSGCYAI